MAKSRHHHPRHHLVLCRRHERGMGAGAGAVRRSRWKGGEAGLRMKMTGRTTPPKRKPGGNVESTWATFPSVFSTMPKLLLVVGSSKSRAGTSFGMQTPPILRWFATTTSISVPAGLRLHRIAAVRRPQAPHRPPPHRPPHLSLRHHRLHRRMLLNSLPPTRPLRRPSKRKRASSAGGVS